MVPTQHGPIDAPWAARAGWFAPQISHRVKYSEFPLGILVDVCNHES
jgi:hypothetical protein